MDKGDERAYDGARKGSGCSLWRKNSAWIEVDHTVERPPEPIRRVAVKTVHAPWRLSELGSMKEHGYGPQDRVDGYFKKKERGPVPDCPDCKEKGRTKKSGSVYGKKRFYCHSCGRYFVPGARKRVKIDYYIGNLEGLRKMVCERHRPMLQSKPEYAGTNLVCSVCQELKSRAMRKLHDRDIYIPDTGEIIS